MKRWTMRFLRRLQDELNSMEGLSGIGGLLLAIVGLGVGGTVRVVLVFIGLSVAVVTLVVAVWRSIPPPMITPSEVEGSELSLRDLDAIAPPVAVIGIVGPQLVGKTTLRNLLLQVPNGNMRSQDVTVHISSIVRNPTTFLAVLDGRGESYSHQFEVAEAADILIVMMDHHIVDTEVNQSDERRLHHVEFGRQIRDRLKSKWDAKSPKYLRVHLLLSKKDLWQKGVDQAALRQLLQQERDLWEAAAFVKEVSTAEHSNVSTVDLMAVATAIKKLWSASVAAGTRS